MKWYDMRCVRRLAVPICSGVRVVGVRGPAVVRLLGIDRWPWVSGYVCLADEEVGFFTCSAYGTCETVFPDRLWILYWVSFFWIP